MRSQHHHPYPTLRAWHAGEREKRQRERWIPYSLRWRGCIFHLPQILLAGFVAAIVCSVSYFLEDIGSMHSPILFPVFGFVVSLSITFRMQSSYNRWWEGREQWDKLSSVSRTFARTLWLHVPVPSSFAEPGNQGFDKLDVIRCICTQAIALKHHLRGEREWVECSDLKPLLAHLPNYNYSATNHPLSVTLYLSSYVEKYRIALLKAGTPIDTQVLTHLLNHIEGLTSIISACERLLRTPIPLGYNIAISRIVWIFVLALPSQLWRELKWWSIAVTMVTAYALFALAEVGLEIENPWGEGPNDLDLDRYCNLLVLDLQEIMSHPQTYEGLLETPALKTSRSLGTLSSAINVDADIHVMEHFTDLAELDPEIV